MPNAATIARRVGAANQARGSIVALLLLQVALASFAVLGKEAVSIAPPLAIEWIRRAAAGLILLAVAAVSGQQVRPARRDLLDAVVPGLLGFGLGRACVMIALSLTSATNVVVIDSGAPVVALLLAIVVGRERPGRWALLGSGLAFAGVAGIVLVGSGLAAPNLGDVVAMGSPLAWGVIYVWMARRSPDSATLLRRTAWFSLAGAAALAGPALAPGPDALAAVLDPRVVGVILLGIAIGVFENALTFRAIATLGPVQAAEFEYLVPCLTALLGLAVLGVPILQAQIAAIGLVTVGLVVAGRARSRATRDERLPGQPCCIA